jgi:hypothetical protein
MKFDAEQNIQHFRRRLDYGAEELTRSVLLEQLLVEENMLGLTKEQLQRIDRHISSPGRLRESRDLRFLELTRRPIGSF